MRYFIFLAMVFVLAGCAGVAKPVVDTAAVDEKTPLVLTRVDYAALPGWGQDDHALALGAFLKSCGRIMKAAPARAFSRNIEAGTMGDWQGICRAAQDVVPQNIVRGQAREFFEMHFMPYA